MKFRFLVSSLLASAWLASFGCSAAEPALAEAAGKHRVDVGDIRGDALRIPLEQRSAVLSKPENVEQLANNLAIRRALAAEAEAAGMGNDPAIAAAVRIARDRLLSDALLARIDATNRPTREVLEALASSYYKANPKKFDLPEEVSSRHILIKEETAGAKATADMLLSQLRQGGDFADLAKKFSQDGSAQNGGLLGFFPPGQLVPEYEAALKKLEKPGDLSPVVKTQFGYHIIRLEERRPPGVRTFDQVKDGLMRELEAKVLNEKRVEYVQRIQSTVVFDKQAIDAFAASQK